MSAHAVVKGKGETPSEQPDFKTRVSALVKTPKFRTVTIVTATGAVTLSTVGGAFGCAAGIVTGSLAGVVPAIFTFGLSIPVGATVGGTVGLAVGASAGGATGAAGGGMIGYGGHQYRNEITTGVIHIKKSALGGVKSVKVMVYDKTNAAKQSAVRSIEYTRVGLTNGAQVVRTRVKQTTSKLERKHIVVGGVGAGAVAGGTTGAGAGALAGAAVGLVPAIFTFGLSIPVCAVIGGGVGAAAGSTGGAAAGGAAAYGGHKYRKEIGDGAVGLKNGANALRLRLTDSADNIKLKARERSAQAREQISAMLGGTGGTE